MKKMCSILLLLCIGNAVLMTSVLGALEFDKLDIDLADLKYEVEEEDLDDYSKLLDQDYSNESSGENQAAKDKAAGNAVSKGVKGKVSAGDIKKIFKAVGASDKGLYDDDAEYAIAEAVTKKAVAVTGNEKRTYKKGTKSRGFHRVHHKDEYKKDKEYYDDDITSGEIKKVGVKVLGTEVGAGSGFNRGHRHHEGKKGIFGKQGYSSNGYFDRAFNKYSDNKSSDQ